MAKANKKAAAVKRQGRRGMSNVRRRAPAKAAFRTRTVTLGELIAAAFETVGGEVKEVAKLLSSNDLACAIQKKIVVTQ
jgi:hypothetical protein